MQATHKNAEDKYQLIREASRKAALEIMPMALSSFASLRDIDQAALVQTKIWQQVPDRQVDWPWNSGHYFYAKRNPKRFELAIWFHSKLCALSIGRPTWSGSRLRLDFVEASPVNNPLKGNVFPVTLVAAETYAEAIGATQIRIMNPINAKVRSHYESFGFIYAGSKLDFCYRDLT